MSLGSSFDNDERMLTGQSQIAEINMTPFVDVVLVLLIIFMITAPFAISGVDVRLPDSRAKSVRMTDDPVVVSINEKGLFYLGKIEVKENELSEKLKGAVGSQKDTTVYIRADRRVTYDKVMRAMSEIHSAGVFRIGMLGEAAGPPAK